MVSVYALLLLGEVCFWNTLGFDRSAAQLYFLAPVPFSRVLMAKNIAALFFIAVELSAVTLACAIIRAPLDLLRIAEAYAVAAVVATYLISAGNLVSVRMARATNPTAQFRSKAAGRVQATLLVAYPLALLPIGLAYLARIVFESSWAFFGVLAFDAIAGLIAYRIALESAVEAAEQRKEQLIADLSAGEGPIAS
jgi:ABC-2 type transport system permease protein